MLKEDPNMTAVSALYKLIISQFWASYLQVGFSIEIFPSLDGKQVVINSNTINKTEPEIIKAYWLFGFLSLWLVGAWKVVPCG